MKLAYIDHRINEEFNFSADKLKKELPKMGFELLIAESYQNYLEQGYTLDDCEGILIHPHKSDYSALRTMKKTELPMAMITNVEEYHDSKDMPVFPYDAINEISFYFKVKKSNSKRIKTSFCGIP